MAEELFWKVYESPSKQYPEFLSSSRNYPGLPHRFRKRTIRAVDSTTIQLTAFSMGWAKHRRQKAAAKMHTALNMRSFLPNFVIVKSACDSDPKSAWELCADMKAGEVVVFDKAYVDFKHLKTLSNKSTHKKDALKKQVPCTQSHPKNTHFIKNGTAVKKTVFRRKNAGLDSGTIVINMKNGEHL